MISLEVARLLQSASEVTVIGIVMIDSVCPWSRAFDKTAETKPSFRETTSDNMKDLVLSSFRHARIMISTWDQPQAFDSPPAVMIRAADRRSVPTAAPSAESGKETDSEVDPDDGRLGWSTFTSLRFLDVTGVPGDHFSMFHDDKVRVPS